MRKQYVLQFCKKSRTSLALATALLTKSLIFSKLIAWSYLTAALVLPRSGRSTARGNFWNVPLSLSSLMVLWKVTQLHTSLSVTISGWSHPSSSTSHLDSDQSTKQEQAQSGIATVCIIQLYSLRTWLNCWYRTCGSTFTVWNIEQIII